MPLWASAAFDVPALTWTFGAHVVPASLLTVTQYWASSFGMPSVSPGPLSPRSLRASWKPTAMYPVVGSSEMCGLNWLFVPASSLTFVEDDHVAPSLSEYFTKMSVLLLSFGVSSV